MIPTSIDGTDITGATIDGTDVTEITVDGQTVFTAETLPVAYSNLIAWYPFDSARYGGSNADDVTANIGGSGDDTAYDGTVTGATYQSSGGVTDINAGANSGAFEFDNSGEEIDCGTPLDSTQPFTVTVWGFANNLTGFNRLLNTNDNDNGMRLVVDAGSNTQFVTENNGSQQAAVTSPQPTNVWVHYAGVFTGGSLELYINGQLEGTGSSNGSGSDPLNFKIGGGFISTDSWLGILDDVRVYNTDLSATQVNQIYTNTQP